MYNESPGYIFLWTGYLGVVARLMGVYILEYKWEWYIRRWSMNVIVPHSLNGDADEHLKCNNYKSVFTTEAMIRIDI